MDTSQSILGSNSNDTNHLRLESNSLSTRSVTTHSINPSENKRAAMAKEKERN